MAKEAELPMFGQSIPNGPGIKLMKNAMTNEDKLKLINEGIECLLRIEALLTGIDNRLKYDAVSVSIKPM